MARSTRRALLTFALVVGFVLAPVSPASAHGGALAGAEVTAGRFTTLPGGADMGMAISGHALMVRLGDRTLVVAHARGLVANTTYPAHVHNAPCAGPTFGGSHYQHVVGGPVDSVNEMWPAVTTNRRGNGLGFATHDHRARPEAMSVVIHYPANTGIRLACVDLA